MLEPMEPPYTRPGSAELAIFLSGVTRGWDPAEDGSAAAACSPAVRSFVPITPLAAAGAGHYHHMPRCVCCACCSAAVMTPDITLPMLTLSLLLLTETLFHVPSHQWTNNMQ